MNFEVGGDVKREAITPSKLALNVAGPAQFCRPCPLSKRPATG